VEPRALRRLAVVAVVMVAAGAGAGIWWRARAPAAPRPSAPPAVALRPRVTVPPGVRITVEVLNTTSARGLARRATLFLRDQGFDVVSFSGASPARDTTLILDRSGHPEWARLVAQALGGAPVESRPDSSRYVDITVLLGASWRPPAEPLYP
jgi:hypothetical protein